MFNINQTVIVKDPDSSDDSWLHSFVGTIIAIDRGIISVRDQENMVFQVDSSQIETQPKGMVKLIEFILNDKNTILDYEARLSLERSLDRTVRQHKELVGFLRDIQRGLLNELSYSQIETLDKLLEDLDID